MFSLIHLEYCSPLLLGVGNNTETTEIETTNYFILRNMLGYSEVCVIRLPPQNTT